VEGDVAAAKRAEAEKLQLLAEQAALEAEQLELEVMALRPPPPPSVPEMDVPAVPEQDVMALKSPLRWIGPYAALSLSLPQLSSPAQKARQLTGDLTSMGVTLDFVLDTAVRQRQSTLRKWVHRCLTN
jgi:hypothetical protein